jgi:hypothetical protein
MSRWMQGRRRYEKKRNAFLLLTLSGAVRSADVEIPYSRERRFAKQSNFASNPVPSAEPSIWSMDIRELVFRKAYRPLCVTKY